MNSTPPETKQVQRPAITYMDPEGHRWPLRNVVESFLPGFYQAVRIEDGVKVMVHRSDFQRTEKG